MKKQPNQIRTSLTWVFKYKFDTNDYVKKFKTRLCFREDLQTTQQDTYAATLAAKTFRALMIISAAFDLDIWQYDAVNAFINSSIDEKLYSECPKEFIKPEYCWKLKKALYELKQAPILWYRIFTNALKELRLHSVSRINCLYVNRWMMLFFYVDDIVIICAKKNAKRKRIFEKALMKRFELRVLEELNWFLRIRVIRNREERKIWLCQDSYIAKMISKFNLRDAKCSKIPLSKLSRSDASSNHDKPNQQLIYAFQQRVESLNFAAIISRSDISFATVKLTQFLQRSSPDHLTMTDRMISYLNETKHLILKYSGRASKIFLCASDAAFADDEVTRRSSDEYLFQLYGGAIDWRTARQVTVITSSTKAKLLALTRTAREAMWWQRFFEAISFDSMKKLHIRCDNRQIIRILDKEMLKLDIKLKHIDIHRHWLKQEMQTNRISISWLLISKMSTDEFIKILSRQKHEKFIKQLHLADISNHLIKTVSVSAWYMQKLRKYVEWIDRCVEN